MNRSVYQRARNTGKKLYLVEDLNGVIKRTRRFFNCDQFTAVEYLREQIGLDDTNLLIPIHTLFTNGDYDEFAPKAEEVRSFWALTGLPFIRLMAEWDTVDEYMLNYYTNDSLIVKINANIPVRLPVGTGTFYTKNVCEDLHNKGINVATDSVLRDTAGLYINGWPQPRVLAVERFANYRYIREQYDLSAEMMNELLEIQRLVDDEHLDVPSPLGGIPRETNRDINYGLKSGQVWTDFKTRSYGLQYDLFYEEKVLEGVRSSDRTTFRKFNTDITVADVEQAVEIHKVWAEWIDSLDPTTRDEVMELYKDIEPVPNLLDVNPNWIGVNENGEYVLSLNDEYDDESDILDPIVIAEEEEI